MDDFTADELDMMWAAMRCYLRNDSDCKQYPDVAKQAQALSAKLFDAKRKAQAKEDK